MNGLIRVQLPKITDARKKIKFSIKLDEEEHKLAFIQEKIGCFPENKLFFWITDNRRPSSATQTT